MPMDLETRQDLERLADVNDPFMRSTPLHITASAYIICPPTKSVLVRWHSVVKNWIQVGGHVDRNDWDPLAAALREAREETGLPDLETVRTSSPWTPLQAVSVTVPESPKERSHRHLDLRYLLRTLSPDMCTPEHAENPVRWITYDAAEGDVTDTTVLAGIRAIALLSERTEQFLIEDSHSMAELLRTQ